MGCGCGGGSGDTTGSSRPVSITKRPGYLWTGDADDDPESEDLDDADDSEPSPEVD